MRQVLINEIQRTIFFPSPLLILLPGTWMWCYLLWQPWNRMAKATLGMAEWFSAEPGHWCLHGTTTCPRLLIISRLHSEHTEITHLAEITTFCCVHPYYWGEAGQGSCIVIDLWGHYISNLLGRFKTNLLPSLFKLLSMLFMMFPDLKVLKIFSTGLFFSFVSLFSF